mmetsp:Transcript_66175/g.123518  ORF Transcript_66175/g.123518 Transcript_66175/m.123518 type:complete len:631 (-) Transcript_66175:79-1971(-)
MQENDGPLLTEEERNVDVCILGTGLTESLLAAAFARHDYRVLHLDDSLHYGGNWRAVNLTELERWATSSDSENQQHFSACAALESDSALEGLSRVPLHDESGVRRKPSCYHQQHFAWDPFNAWEAEELEAVKQELRKSPNAFSIDLVPRLLFGRSDLVDVLIESGVARYLEFQGLRAAKVLTSSGLATVPITKSEIFQDPVLSLPEKRALMRFITSMMPFVGSLAFESPAQLGVDRVRHVSAPADPSAVNLGNLDYDSSWQTFLEQQHLSSRLQDFLTYAICLWDGVATPSGQDGRSAGLTVRDGLKNLGRFVSSLGLHGQGMPLLYPMYGAAEMAQGFTRMCALHRGTYALRTSVSELLAEGSVDEPSEWRIAGVVTQRGEVIRAKTVVAARDQVLHHPTDGSERDASSTDRNFTCARMIALTKCALLGAEGLSFCVVPPGGSEPPLRAVVQVLQLDFSTGTCPRGYNMIHLSQVGEPKPGEDPFAQLSSVLARLLDLAPGGEQNCLFRCTYLHSPGCGEPLTNAISRSCIANQTLQFCQDPTSVPQLLAECESAEAREMFLASGIHGAERPPAESFLRKPAHVAMEERSSAMEELANFNVQMTDTDQDAVSLEQHREVISSAERAAGA